MSVVKPKHEIELLEANVGAEAIVKEIGPTTTPYNSQVKVTIFGQGFASPVAVSLAGIAATVLSTSGTEIDVLSGIPTISGCANVASAVSVTPVRSAQTDGAPNCRVIQK